MIETLPPSDGKHPAEARLLGRRWLRVAVVLVFAFAVGFALRHVGRKLEARGVQAGFAQGFFQGATMPLAFPTLLVGVDVNIYAVDNDGVPYKLGYTLGVTGCGAAFFGTVYGRMARWRSKS